MNQYFTWKDLLWYIAIEAFAYIVFFALGGVLFFGFPLLQQYKDVFVTIAIFFGQVAFLFPIIFFFFYKERTHFFSTLGFHKVTWKELLLYPLGVFLTIQTGFVILTVISEYYALQIPGFSGEQKNIVNLLNGDTWQVVSISFVAVVLAPIVEEIVFRGFLLSVLRLYLPAWLAAVVSAFVFALMHGEADVVLMLFFIACGFSFLFVKTKSIYPGIVYHTINNIFALVVLLFMKQ